MGLKVSDTLNELCALPEEFIVDEGFRDPPEPEYRKGAPSYILIVSDGICLYVLDSIGPRCDDCHDDTVGYLEETRFDCPPEPGIYVIEPYFSGPDYNGECDTELEPFPLTEIQRFNYLYHGAPWNPYVDKDGKSWYVDQPLTQTT